MRSLLLKYRKLPVQVKASIWFAISAVVVKGITVITTPVFTRLMTPGEYGQFNIFTSWQSILTIFVSLNLYCGVYTQGLVKFEERRGEFISALHGLTLTLVFIWLAIYLCFQNFWNHLFSLTTIQMLAMLSMIWSIAVYGFWSVDERVRCKYKTLVSVTIVSSFLRVGVGIAAVFYSHDKVTARILSLAGIDLLCYGLLFVFHVHHSGKFYSGEFWRYALLFNLPLIPHYLSQSVLSVSDRIMIGKMVGESEAGIYSLAYSLSLLMNLVSTAMLQTIEPWIYKKIKANEFYKLSGVAYPAFVIIALCNLCLIAVAPEIIAIFAPPQYHSAKWIVPCVSMSTFFSFAYVFFAAFEFYYEKTKFIALSTIIGAILNIILNYIFIPIFGYMAAAYTTLICYFIYAISHYVFMIQICHGRNISGEVYHLPTLLRIVGLFFVLGMAFLLSYHCNWARGCLIVSLLVLLFLYKEKLFGAIREIIILRNGNSMSQVK